MGEHGCCFHRGLLGKKEPNGLALLWNIVHLLLFEFFVGEGYDFVNPTFGYVVVTFGFIFT